MKQKILTSAIVLLISMQASATEYSRDSDSKVLYTSDLSTPEPKGKVGTKVDTKESLTKQERLDDAKKRQQKARSIKKHGDRNIHWRIKSGSSVVETIETWATSNGWQLQWDVEGNFITSTKAAFGGSIQNAIDQLLMGINSSNDINLKAVFYTKNRVIRVSEK